MSSQNDLPDSDDAKHNPIDSEAPHAVRATAPVQADDSRDEEDGDYDDEEGDFLESDEDADSLLEDPEALAVASGDSAEAHFEPSLEPEPPLVPEPAVYIDEHDDGEIPFSKFDPDALKVVSRLRSFGHEAYFVGGCVRDILLGRNPKDFDIATSATPNEVRGIFRNCRLIGRRFRLAHVYFKGGKIMEVSTFRANPAEGEEGSDPGVGDEGDLLITHDNVFGTAQEDARRRDFTINGLFYDIGEGEVIDYVRGRRDLDERFIRTIGDPERRMREDPVRILRAVRFACKLELDIESRTYAAMEGTVEDLTRCAPPRLLEETFRLIRGGISAPAIKLLAALDALKLLLPPIDAYFRSHGAEGEKEFYAHAAALDRRVREGAPIDDAILLAALLVPLSRAEPMTEEEGGRPSVAQAIEDLLAEFVSTARLPRRIAERCRMLLIAQRTLTGERRRRGSQASFRGHPIFHDAMRVFEIHVEATGNFKAELAAWKSGEAPAPKGGAEGPRKKRRRRRGGRRPEAGEKAPAQSTGSED